MTRDLEAYGKNYTGDYGFEALMVYYRRLMLLARLHELKPLRILEIGCGQELLAEAYYDGDGRWDDWVIVEPVSEFAEYARNRGIERVSVINATFDLSIKVLDCFKPDLVICSSLLHEVVSAEELLNDIIKVMCPHTVLHINVPNSGSLHRRLAQSMGLIEKVEDLSDRNVALQQSRVFNVLTLKRAVEGVGLRTTSSGGYFIKPFTHKQMDAISDTINGQILDGLFELGKALPDLASEIYLEAKVK